MIFLFLILLFIYPLTYSSEIKILPPEEKSYNGLSGLFGEGDASSLLGLGGMGGNSQLYAEILKSRSAAEYVIDKCGLVEFYNEDNIQRSVASLSKNLDVQVTKEGIILLSVDLSTPMFSRFSDVKDSVNYLAAEVSNTFAEALDKINREKLNIKAKQTREYVESQIALTKTQLDSAEQELKIFQEEYKTISLPKQLEAAIEHAAEIKSQIYFNEIKLKTLELNMDKESRTIISLRKKLDVLKEQYAKIEAGDKLNKDFLPNFEDVPEISIRLARLTRNVKVLNEVYMLLQTQYYREKLQENKNIPTVQVLDNAIPSLRAKSPRLVFHTFAGGLFAFIFICSVIVVQQYKIKELQNKVS
jgi:uncharacterized protein involved in exopolysaccharide biosynthesis